MMRGAPGMGGGRVIRAVGRAVGASVAGAKGTIAAGKPARMVSVSSPAATAPAAAAAAGPAGPSVLPCFCDGDEWEAVEKEVVEIEAEEGEEDMDIGGGFGFADRFVFGPAPSREEAQDAVTTLQQIFVPVAFSCATEDGHPSSVDEFLVEKVMTSIGTMSKGSSTESESDWLEPAMHLYSAKSAQYDEREKVLDAFRLLQVNPSVQRMVVSLSCDKAVWDAVMKNEVVQEFKKSFYEAENNDSDDEVPDAATGFLRWIFDNTKGKLMEFFDMIAKLVSETFHSKEKDKKSAAFDDVLRSSFMLSIVVFMIVVVVRSRRA